MVTPQKATSSSEQVDNDSDVDSTSLGSPACAARLGLLGRGAHAPSQQQQYRRASFCTSRGNGSHAAEHHTAASASSTAGRTFGLVHLQTVDARAARRRYLRRRPNRRIAIHLDLADYILCSSDLCEQTRLPSRYSALSPVRLLCSSITSRACCCGCCSGRRSSPLVGCGPASRSQTRRRSTTMMTSLLPSSEVQMRWRRCATPSRMRCASDWSTPRRSRTRVLVRVRSIRSYSRGED